MSTGGKTEITCGCGHRFEAWLWQSANVTASPELKQQVLGGDMNMVKCPSCGSRFHVEVPFLYHDIEAKEWIWVYPRDHVKQSGDIHMRVQAMWNELKQKVPENVRDVFEQEYKVIVLFGMDSLVFYLRGKAQRDEIPS
jgi:hypothetical protein